MRSLIVAVNDQHLIGQNGTIPWHYPLDLKRFMQLTLGTTVIMGHNTWQSLPKKPLHGRENFVLTKRSWISDGVRTFKDVRSAVDAAEGDVWFIGGKKVYESALSAGLVDMMDVTVVPDRIRFSLGSPSDNVYFNVSIFEHTFVRDFSIKHPDSRLKVVRYHKLDTADAQVILQQHFISSSCMGEKCFCGEPATHKLGEEILSDDPRPSRARLSTYVCCKHFTQVLGQATGCDV